MGGALAASAAIVYAVVLRPRGYHQWLVPYILQRSQRRAPVSDADVHVLLSARLTPYISGTVGALVGMPNPRLQRPRLGIVSG